MIKVYFDWNVISQMKNNYHSDLQNIVFDNEKLFIPYSTSHIGDIFSSFKNEDDQRNLVDNDLNYISKLTNNICLFNNGKEVALDFRVPSQLFKQRIDEKDLFNDISIDGLSKIFDQNELTKEIGKSLITLSKSITLEESFKKAFENSESGPQMENMFPGLKENPTLEGFFNSFNKMNIGLNEQDKYKDLRKTIQSSLGINRDKIFDNIEPYKIIDKQHLKQGFSLDEYIDNSKNGPEWFNKISNEYIMLDMHGYQEDNVNIKKGRKETFRNTTEDAFHASFASTCNFYVINDNRSYKKTIKVYEKLSIKTLVFKPDEFVEYYNKFLNIQDVNLNITILFDIIENGEYYSSEADGSTYRTYYIPFYLFDFFNKITILVNNDKNEKPSIILSQNKPLNCRIYSLEMKKLGKEITKLCGIDIDNLGEINEGELQAEIWIGRKWKLHQSKLQLIKSNGYIKLNIDL